MAVLGHTTLAEAERYTEEADQAGLAEDAVIKLEGHKSEQICPNRFRRFRKDCQNKEKSK